VAQVVLQVGQPAKVVVQVAPEQVVSQVVPLQVVKQVVSQVGRPWQVVSHVAEPAQVGLPVQVVSHVG